MKQVRDPALLAQLEGGGLRSVQDPAMLAQLEFDIDVTQPVETVRSALSNLQGQKRDRALQLWADAFVAKERAEGGIGQTINNAVRTVARGSFVGPYLDEVTGAGSAALHAATGGRVGAPYDETVAYQRAVDRAIDEANPALSTAGKLAGGIAGGVAAARTGAGTLGTAVGGPLAWMRPAATIPGRIRQSMTVGGTYGAVQGFGEGEGGFVPRAENAAPSGVLGTVLGGGFGVGAETVRGVRTAMAGQGRTGAYNRLAGQLDEGVDTLANQVATGGARNDQAIQRRTLDILGEEMERAAGNRGQAVAATVNRIAAEAQITPAAARDRIRRLTSVHADSPLMLAEYPAAAGSNAAIRGSRNPANVDLQQVARPADSGAHMVLDDLANQAGARSAAMTRNTVAERNLGMRDEMRQTLSGMAPRAPGGAGPRTIADLDQMQEGARRAAQIEYQAAYAAPTNNRLLVGLLPRIMDRHANRMAGRSGEQAEALQRAIGEFTIARPDGTRVAMQTLQQMQDARGVVRGMIDRAQRAGDRHIVQTLQPLYDDVTRLMQRANPTWARANRRWADDRLDTVGRELGEAFSLRAGPQYREQLRQYNRLAPEAQDMVRVEFLQRLDDRLANLGDTHDVAKLFATEHVRSIVRTLFGDRAVVDLARATRDASIATRSARMMGNSPTSMRWARRAEADQDTGILAAAQHANTGRMRDWIVQKLTSVLTERRNIPLAEIATTPMRDMAEVARHVHNMRAAQRYQQRLAQPGMGALYGAAGAGGLSANVVTQSRRQD